MNLDNPNTWFYKTNILSILVSSIPFFLILSIFIADLILSVSALGFLIFILITKKFNIFKNKVFIISNLFVCVCLVSSLFTDNVSYYFLNSLKLVRFAFFILLVQYLIDYDKKFLKFFLNSLKISILFLFAGFFLQVLEFEFISKYLIGNRFSSFFFDEHIMGSYLVKILPLTLCLMIFFNEKKLLFLIFLISLFLIIVSGERAAVISISMFLILLIFFTNFFNTKIKIYFFLILILFSTTTLYLFPKVKFRIIDQTLFQLSIIEPERDYVEFKISDNPERWTAIAREDYFIPLKYYLMFSSGLNMFSDNYLTGSGIKSFRIKCKELKYYSKRNYKAFRDKPDDYYEGFTGIDNCSTHPHNYYIQLLAETGIFSFIIVLSVWFVSFFKFFKIKFIENKIIYLSIVVNLFPLITTGSLYNNYLSILLILPFCFIRLEKKIKS